MSSLATHALLYTPSVCFWVSLILCGFWPLALVPRAANLMSTYTIVEHTDTDITAPTQANTHAHTHARTA